MLEFYLVNNSCDQLIHQQMLVDLDSFKLPCIIPFLGIIF